MPTIIQNILPRMILDSRGFPTIEVEILLTDGSSACASVPSGASTGDKEAVELRDNNKKWCGKGIEKAIENIKKHIKPKIIGMTPYNIKSIDQTMIKLDGTDNKSKLGANAILAVSLANVRVGAVSKKQNLYQYIYEYLNSKDLLHNIFEMPIPMMNILNGGSHSDNNLDIQEFMIMPTNFKSYSEALQAGTEVFHCLKSILKSKNYSTTIGDEGGFAPTLRNNEEAIELILEAIDKTNYKPGKEISLGLDVAASELYNQNINKYHLRSENKTLSALELIEYYENLCNKYPIVSIEDGLDQNDWKHWKILNDFLGDKVQIVGDDLTVTNSKLLQKAIELNTINAILIKLNQIGTFSETIKSIQIAQQNNLGVIISHRSGETEDTFISDLSVATNAGQIKAGSLCRTERTAKYNQLLRIEEHLHSKAKYATFKF